MPASAAIIARDQRILAGHAAGATILDLALAEEVDPAVVWRVLLAAGVTPGSLRQPSVDRAADDGGATGALAGPTLGSAEAWLRAEYATKGGEQIARELGCSPERVYRALHAAGIPMHKNGYPPAPKEIPPATAERVVALYLAGASARRVAADLGLRVRQVNRLVAERGIKRSRSEMASLARAARRPGERSRTEWPLELQAEVLERYAAGESGEAISASLGLVSSRVYRFLRERRPSEWLPANRAAEALARYAAGQAPKVIAP